MFDGHQLFEFADVRKADKDGDFIIFMNHRLSVWNDDVVAAVNGSNQHAIRQLNLRKRYIGKPLARWWR